MATGGIIYGAPNLFIRHLSTQHKTAKGKSGCPRQWIAKISGGQSFSKTIGEWLCNGKVQNDRVTNNTTKWKLHLHVGARLMGNVDRHVICNDHQIHTPSIQLISIIDTQLRNSHNYQMPAPNGSCLVPIPMAQSVLDNIRVSVWWRKNANYGFTFIWEWEFRFRSLYFGH